jgi:hypothetical protein
MLLKLNHWLYILATCLCFAKISATCWWKNFHMFHDHLKYNYENNKIVLQSGECWELYDESDASSTFQSGEWWE